MYDVIVIGGGPAGMSAALATGRAKMNVLLIDDNKPRNAATQESHAYLTQDGIPPGDFRLKGQADLAKYPTIQLINQRIQNITQTTAGHFELLTQDDVRYHTRYLVLASGISEQLPSIAQLPDYYGRSIFSCPFCDGWELQNQPLVFITNRQDDLHRIKLVKQWTDDLIVATHGPHDFTDVTLERLEANNIAVVSSPIQQLHGDNGQLSAIGFSDGQVIERQGGFCTPTYHVNTDFAKPLGLQFNEHGFITIDSMGRTNIVGVFAAGEITGPSQLIVSASQGNLAGNGIIFDASEASFNQAKGRQ